MHSYISDTTKDGQQRVNGYKNQKTWQFPASDKTKKQYTEEVCCACIGSGREQNDYPCTLCGGRGIV